MPQSTPAARDTSYFYRMGCVTKGLSLLSLLAVLVALMVTLVGHARAEDRPTPPALPACVHVKTSVRYIMGYDHLVHVTNDCDETAHCKVTTNVNPEAIPVTVAPKTTETVLTFRGSPARVFTEHVECSLEAAKK